MANNQVVKQQSKFYKAADVAEILGVSQTTAYRIIRSLNQELKEQGKITIAGRQDKFPLLQWKGVLINMGIKQRFIGEASDSINGKR